MPCRSLCLAFLVLALAAPGTACVGDDVLLGTAGSPPPAGEDPNVALAPSTASALAAALATPPLDCDRDRDGYEAIACGGLDCDDGAADVHPDAPEAEDWSVELVAEDASLPSVAVDSEGGVHVVVRALVSGGATLRALTRTADGWQSEDIAPLADGPWAPALAVGRDHHLHACWTNHDERTTEVGYAVSVGHGWQSETLLSGAGDPSSCAIAVDPHGAVHVALQDPATRNLRHAVLINGTWKFDIVDPRPETGEFPVVLIDSFYVPSIGYQDADGNLLHAARSATGWAIESVHAAGLPAGRSLGDFAIDPEGFAHATFRDAHLRAFRYATDAGGAWETEVVESTGYTGKCSAVAVDAVGNAHVVYSLDDRRDHPDDLVFRTNAAGAWSGPQLIDDEGSTGFAPRLVIGPSGLHVVYFRMGDDGRTEVLHAHRALPDAVDRDCDGQF